MLTETRRAERGHDFYPPADQLAAIPPPYATENTKIVDTVIHLHYLIPGCATDWWIAELDPATGLAYGYARLAGDDANAEWGYLSLPELEALHQPGGATPNGTRPPVAVGPASSPNATRTGPHAPPPKPTCPASEPPPPESPNRAGHALARSPPTGADLAVTNMAVSEPLLRPGDALRPRSHRAAGRHPRPRRRTLPPRRRPSPGPAHSAPDTGRMPGPPLLTVANLREVISAHEALPPLTTPLSRPDRPAPDPPVLYRRPLARDQPPARWPPRPKRRTRAATPRVFLTFFLPGWQGGASKGVTACADLRGAQPERRRREDRRHPGPRRSVRRHRRARARHRPRPAEQRRECLCPDPPADVRTTDDLFEADRAGCAAEAARPSAWAGVDVVPSSLALAHRERAAR